MMDIEQLLPFDLLHEEVIYMSRVPCLRRYVRSKKPKIEQRHLLYLTNYRLVFEGPYQEVFPMEVFFRDITQTDKTPIKSKDGEIMLFQIKRIMRDSSKEEREEKDILGFEKDELMALERIEQYIQRLTQKNTSESELDLKKRILVADKIRYGVYMNLVHNLKLISEEDFWDRHNFIVLNRLDQRLIFDKLHHQEKPGMIQARIDDKGRPPPKEVSSATFQGYSIRKDIDNLSLRNKSQEINEQTKTRIIEQIQDMYLRESSAYQHLRVTEPENLTNEGIVIVRNDQRMEIEETKDSIPYTKLPAVKIPEGGEVKFRIKNEEITKQIESSDAGIKYRKKMENPGAALKDSQKDLTMKVVENVRLFYLCMSKKSNDTVGKMEKEIQKLKREVEELPGLDQGKELASFINKSLANCMNYRKGEFYT